MKARKAAVLLAVMALGGVTSFYVTGWWLRRQWEKFLEGE